MDEVVVRYQATAEDAVIGSHWHYRHSVRPFFRGALWVFAALFLLIGSAGLFSGQIVEGSIMLAVGAFMISALTVVTPWIVRRRFRKLADVDLEAEWRFSSDAIQIRSSLGHSELVWKAVAKVVCTPDGFLFYPFMQQQHFWLPRRGFANEADFDRVAELAKRYARKFRRLS